MKRYFYCLGYVLFLLYVPGLLIAGFWLWQKEISFLGFWEIADPLYCLNDWADLLESIRAYPLIVLFFIPIFYAVWRWFRKPSWPVAILLAFCFIVLNPLFEPQLKLYFFLCGEAPLIQSFL